MLRCLTAAEELNRLVVSPNAGFLGRWNSQEPKAAPGYCETKEEAKILLLACCYQEVSIRRLFHAPHACGSVLC
jgi:hypothetical protein